MYDAITTQNLTPLSYYPVYLHYPTTNSTPLFRTLPGLSTKCVVVVRLVVLVLVYALYSFKKAAWIIAPRAKRCVECKSSSIPILEVVEAVVVSSCSSSSSRSSRSSNSISISSSEIRSYRILHDKLNEDFTIVLL